MDMYLMIMIVTVGLTVFAWNDRDRMYKWMMNPVLIREQNEWHRFLTSGFIHANWPHLIFNMFTFYWVGKIVEMYFAAEFGPTGGIYFLLFYLASIIISEIPSYLKHLHNRHYFSLGASGGVSAVLFAAIALDPTIPFFFALPGFLFGLLYLWYSWYASHRQSTNINHDAHFYGAVFGLVFPFIFMPQYSWDFIDQVSNWRF